MTSRLPRSAASRTAAAEAHEASWPGIVLLMPALHALFHGSGHTPAGWIRHRRVEACKRDLADPAAGTVPVAAIGARWGFADPSHFGQVFKAATGLTPAEFRRAITP